MRNLFICRSTGLFSLSLAALLASTLYAPAAVIDIDPPTVTLLSPNCPFVRTPMVEIHGTATDDVGLKTLQVQTGSAHTSYTTLTNISLSGRSATWSVTVPLTEGLNYLLIRVIDASGKTQCDLRNPTNHGSCAEFYAVYYPTNRGPTSFQAWQVAHFTPAELQNPAVSGPDADPDMDGSNNFLEYAANTDPKVANQPTRVTASVEDQHLTMTYARAKNAIDVASTVRVSTNLIAWSSDSELVGTLDLGATLQFKARMYQPMTSAPAGFMQLQMQKTSPMTFSNGPSLILANNCQSCHLPGGSSGYYWYDGDVYSNLVGYGAGSVEIEPRVFPGFPEFSFLYEGLTTTNTAARMPYQRPPLRPSDVEIIRKWIEDGALP